MLKNTFRMSVLGGLVIVALVVASLLLSAESLQGNGTLTGNVSIGPLCPVEPCMIPPDSLAAAYAARPITVSTPGGTAVATVVADPVIGYSVALPPGTYVVDVPHPAIGGSRDLPQTVTIRSGAIVRLNISIDTGIR